MQKEKKKELRPCKLGVSQGREWSAGKPAPTPYRCGMQHRARYVEHQSRVIVSSNNIIITQTGSA